MNTHEMEYEPFGDEDNVSALVPTEIETVKVRTDMQPNPIDPNEMPDLDAMEEGFSLEQRYVRFEQEGQTERGVLIGYNQMQGKQGTKPIAIFQNKNGIWANAGDNLIRQVSNVPIGTPLVITYRGQKRTQSGNEVKSFEVRVLKPKAGAPPPPPVAVDMSHLKSGGVFVPSKSTSGNGDAFQDLENLVAKHAEAVNKVAAGIPDPAMRKYRAEAAMQLAKTAIGSDEEMRHAFLYEIWGRAGLTECNAQELMAFRDWAQRENAKQYIAAWVAAYQERNKMDLFAEAVTL